MPRRTPKLIRASIDARILAAVSGAAAPITTEAICRALWPDQDWAAMKRVSAARSWPELASGAWYVHWRAGVLVHRGLLRRVPREETDQFQLRVRRVGNA